MAFPLPRRHGAVNWRGLGALTGRGIRRFFKEAVETLGGPAVSSLLLLAVFSQLRTAALAFPVGFGLGFCYFMTATAITTTLQLNLRDTERAAVMPLWFMVFGGTVPIGNLLFGVVIEWVGARAVLGFGAAFALLLAWWVDLRRLPASAFLPEAEGGEPLPPTNASRLI